MASGSFYVPTSNEYVRGEVAWSAVKDDANTRSSVTVTLKFSRTNTGYTTIRTVNCKIRIGENSGSYTEYDCDENGDEITITYNSHTFAGDATRNVTHSADGTGTAYIRISGSLDGSSASDYALTTTTQTVTLDTITNASTVTVFTVPDIGSGSTINLSATTTSYSAAYNLDFALFVGATEIVAFAEVAGWTNIACSGGAGQVHTLALTAAQQTEILVLMPASTSATVTIHCRTQSGSTTIGATKTRTATATAHANVKPAVSSIGKTGGLLLSGKYVQNRSTVAVAISATAGSGSTITGYATTITGITGAYSGASFTSVALPTSGTVTIETTVTDARNRTVVSSTTLTVYAYANPVLAALTAQRCTSGGTLSDTGTYCKFALTGSISAVDNSNSKSFKIQAKLQSGSTWSDLYTYTSAYTIDWTAGSAKVYQISGGFSIDAVYDVRVAATDSYGTTHAAAVLGTEFVLLDFHESGNFMAIGKVSSGTKLLEIGAAGKTLADIMLGANTLLDVLHPVGSIYISTAATNPGTLMGGTWSAFGAGKTLVGLNAADTAFDTAEETGGAKTVTLDATMIPAHTHGSKTLVGTIGNIAQQSAATALTASGIVALSQEGTGYGYGTGTTNSGDDKATITATHEHDSIGGGLSHTNLPPYIVTYMWKRTA